MFSLGQFSFRTTLLASAALLATLAPPAHAAATPTVGLGTAGSFAVLAGSTITNTGPTVINGDLGLHPGTAVTGFPPGTVNGDQHINDAVARQAKADLVTAYNDAASRPMTATLPADLGGRRLVSGVYRTGSTPSLGLTGNVTLDAQGDPTAVWIFQIASTLTTATDSSVTLVNGAQSCHVFWQVGSSATLGTRTAFKGNILAQTSISVDDAVVADGRLLARDGAVTFINDTVTRAQCAAGTEGTVGGDAGGTGTGGGGIAGDTRGPTIRVAGPRGVLGPPVSPPATARPGRICVTRNFTARIRVRDVSGIRSVRVFLDGKRIKRTHRSLSSVVVRVNGLKVGKHTLKVVAVDRAGNRRVVKRAFTRCTLALAAPRFTG